MHLNGVAGLWETTLDYFLALAEFLLSCIQFRPKNKPQGYEEKPSPS